MQAFGSMVMALFSLGGCGGPDKPADAPAEPSTPAPAESAAPTAEAPAAADAGAAATEQAATPPPTGDLSEVCQKAGSAYEKRARPAIKACYREGKKGDPNLMGTARIVIDVAFDGKPKPAKLDGVSSLGDDVAKCMVDAVTKTAFPEGVDCKGRQLTIPVEFPSKAK